MVDIHTVLILIDTVAIFFQGFSFRRRHTLILLISSITIMSTSILSIILDGVNIYVNTISNASMYNVILALAYVIFWWMSGYIIGGSRIIRSED